MIRLRAPLSILLVLVLALTVSAAGAARGQVSDSGGIVICTGLGVVTLADGSGDGGGGAIRLCPDCVATALAFAAVPPVVLPAPAGWRIMPFSLSPQAVLHAPPIPHPPARGPPVPV